MPSLEVDKALSGAGRDGPVHGPMKVGVGYRCCREGNWSLLVHPQSWSQGLWAEVLPHLRSGVPRRHPQTESLRYPQDGSGSEFYLKVYRRSDSLGTVKDLFRSSKAVRGLRQGEALSREGFHAPLAVAAGEERRLGLLSMAFLLTHRVEGTLLPYFLLERFSSPLAPSLVREKRHYLKKLALEIRRLHQFGFVHGDLTPYNILVQESQGRIDFYYMDNDRTRRYPSCLRWLPALWKRNLVQLNRFALPGISLQDRVRFLRHYVGPSARERDRRRLFRWLEFNTRRRWRDRGVPEERVSFRELMRWKGLFKIKTRGEKRS